MRTRFAAMITLLALALPVPALANNPAVEKALAAQPQLSSFTQALAQAGILSELRPDVHYTVFAPDNDAYARFMHDHPCFATPECSEELAIVLRNHIFRGRIRIDYAVAHSGGLRSISDRFVTIGTPSINTYALAGNEVISTTRFHGGMLYTLNGVIASQHELAVAPLAGPPVQKVSTQSSEKDIDDPACAGGKCPDTSSQTTTIETTTGAPGQ